MAVGFIGLGTLGRVMARRLIDQGIELVVWNRTRSRAEDLGVPVADHPADLASKSEVVFLNLFDSDAVREVLAGQNGLLTGGTRDKIIIDTTTNHFADVKGFYGLCARTMSHYVESPVLGSVVPASKGQLTIAVSGVRAAYDIARPYLEKLGDKIFYLEEPTLATRMKLINNLALGSIMATLAEAVTIGEACGIEREKVLDILGAAAGNSAILNAKRQKLLDEDFSVHFASKAIYKDLHFLQDLARETNRPAFVAAAVKEIFALNAAKGVQDEDFSVIYRTLKNL